MARPVVVTSGGYSVQPLWPHLAEHFDLVVAAPQAVQAARALGVPEGVTTAVNDYYNGDAAQEANTETARLIARVVNAQAQVQARVTALTVGLSAPPALNGQFPDWWAGYVLHQARQYIATLAALDMLREQRQVAGVVVHEDLTADMRLLALWARANDLPSVHVPHAPCHLQPGVRDIHRETRTTHIAAGGPRVAEFYRESGAEADIRITGAPQWDYLYRPMPTREEARRVLNVDGLVLAYASTWTQTTSLRSGFEAELRRGMLAVVDAARTMRATLVFKIHPGEPQSAEQGYAEVARQAGIRALVVRQHHPYVLRAVDCIVAQGPSNVCVDAAILGTPSCYIQTDGFDYRTTPFPYRAGPDKIADAIQDAIDSTGDPEWEEFVDQYNAAHPDGGAAEQAAEYVRAACPVQA